MQMISLLGATGSIGVSTLDVIARHPDKYAIYALTAYTQVDKLAEQCQQFNPKFAVVGDAVSAERLQVKLRACGCDTEALYGLEALCQVASDAAVDTVMAAIVDAAGLVPTLAAVKAGKKILLANKEALVMAGGLFMQAVADSGSVLLPIDSEHNAIFQCLPSDYGRSADNGVKKLLLSASGGPFCGWTLEQMQRVTPDQACAHPNWSMGRKISVDSATLMNKGLELIEACWLFAVPERSIDVIVHPQSIIHSLVQYSDGSVLAQLGNPDMRTPIAHALAWPQRIDSGVANLDLFDIARLDFEQPDMQAFPSLAIARAAAQAGANAATIMNAANEVAVQAFLDQRIGFTQIAEIVEQTLNSQTVCEPESLEAVQESDSEARLFSSTLIKSLEK